MTILKSTPGAGHFILSEAGGYRSRQRIVVGASQTLLAGAVLGAVGEGAATVTPGPKTGPGDGAIGAWTADAGAAPGRWLIRLLATGATAAFAVYRPDGSLDGQGAVGTAYNGGINGTLADGATDWGVGAEIPVQVAYAASTYFAHDPEGTDGREVPAALLFDDVLTGVGETADAVGMVRDCEVAEHALVWGDHSDAEKVAALTALAAAGVIARH